MLLFITNNLNFSNKAWFQITVQSKDLLVRVYFGRSYLEPDMGMHYGAYRNWLGVFCYPS